MRVVVLVLIGIISSILSGTVLKGNYMVGLQADIILIIALSLSLIEKDTTGIIFGAGAGLLTDIMFGTVIGLNAISITIVTALCYAFFRNRQRLNLLFLAIIGMGGYILKELIVALIVYMMGGRFDIVFMMYRYILFSALLSGILMYLLYGLLTLLYKNSWMKKKQTHLFDDF